MLLKKLTNLFRKKDVRTFRYVSELSIVEAEELLSVLMDEKFSNTDRKISFFKRFGEGYIKYNFIYLDFRVHESKTEIIEIDAELVIRDDFLVVTSWSNNRSDIFIKYKEAVSFLESLNVRRYDETHKQLIHA